MGEVSGVGVIIVAAGKAERMGTTDKIFASLGGKPVLAWSVDICQRCSLVKQIIITLNNNNLKPGQKLKEERAWTKATICLGGAQRQDSVREGIRKLKGCDWVIIHDGARPFLTLDLIQNGLEAVRETGAAIAAVPVKDTIKFTDDTGLITETPQRNKLWVGQTPQIFSFDIINKAYQKLTAEVTDDAAAVERSGHKVKIYPGDYNNIKISTPEDLALAEIIARLNPEQSKCPPCYPEGHEGVKEELRVGIGYDSHPLVPGRKLVLGGVNIPYDRGLLGRSDADVATHAVIDALCGAAGLGDIGTRFPSEEPRHEGISSLDLLNEIRKLLEGKSFKVTNIDTTIIAQRPKLSPFVPEMRKQISQALGIKTTQVTIKATSTDGLGFIGREEGIAAQSVALIQRKNARG